MTLETIYWTFFKKQEFESMTYQNNQLPQPFRNQKVFLILKDTIETNFKYLNDYDGREVTLNNSSILIVKLGREKWIGFQSPSENFKNPINSSEHFIFKSETMSNVMNIVRKVSLVDSTVLLLGETGVGKSLIARKLHKYSNRSEKPFVEINCSTIPEALIEAELFGYTPGSFTGGIREGKKGVFESAIGGTVFLDEVGEVPLHLQPKLLEVLQENHIRPIGSIESIPVNVRIVAATNRDLEKMVHQKLFREDLFYRLNVVPINIPSLRERVDDLELLITRFLDKFNEKHKTNKSLTPKLLSAFYNYSWPGNIRELKNMIERLIVTTENNSITLKNLPKTFLKADTNEDVINNEFIPLKKSIEKFEREIIIKAYNHHKTTYKTAEVLRMSQSSIAKKIKKYRDEGKF